MTKPKGSVSFNHNHYRERRPSQDMSPVRSRSNGPTRNGTITRAEKQERPGYDRTDTAASGWATDNEEDDKVRSAALNALCLSGEFH